MAAAAASSSSMMAKRISASVVRARTSASLLRPPSYRHAQHRPTCGKAGPPKDPTPGEMMMALRRMERTLKLAVKPGNPCKDAYPNLLGIKGYDDDDDDFQCKDVDRRLAKLEAKMYYEGVTYKLQVDQAQLGERVTTLEGSKQVRPSPATVASPPTPAARAPAPPTATSPTSSPTA